MTVPPCPNRAPTMPRHGVTQPCPRAPTPIGGTARRRWYLPFLTTEPCPVPASLRQGIDHGSDRATAYPFDYPDKREQEQPFRGTSTAINPALNGKRRFLTCPFRLDTATVRSERPGSQSKRTPGLINPRGCGHRTRWSRPLSLCSERTPSGADRRRGFLRKTQGTCIAGTGSRREH